MEELIKRLRAEANDNIAYGQPSDTHGLVSSPWCTDLTGVIISNSEALKFANFLEWSTYPPIVQMALVFLSIYETNSNWFAIDRSGEGYEYHQKPELSENKHWWHPDGAVRLDKFPRFVQPKYFNLLFHRAPDGWQWVGNKQTDKENEK